MLTFIEASDDEIVPDTEVSETDTPESEADRLMGVPEDDEETVLIEEKVTKLDDVLAGANSWMETETQSESQAGIDVLETEIETEIETEKQTNELIENETEALETEVWETEVEESEILETEVEETEALETEIEETEVDIEAIIADYPYDEDKAVALAQLMWAEARGCSKREQSLVAWTVLNRVDVNYDGQVGFWAVLTAPCQFAYYSGRPFEQYELDMAIGILQHWVAEKDGYDNLIRTLPHDYLYYHGDGEHNWFSPNGSTDELWFGLPDPYENW